MKRKIITLTLTIAALATLSSCSNQRSQNEIIDLQARAARAAGSTSESIGDLRAIDGFTCAEIKESEHYEDMLRGTIDVDKGWLTLTLASIACPGGIEALLDEVESR